jgi:hypothetical protein
MFWYVFWEPVLYYDPMATFPKPTFLPGRFIGIARDHGDAFTYRIWTEPNGDWTEGRELIRNVVKSRQGAAQLPRAEAPIINFTTKRRQRKTANRGPVDEVDANDALIELPEEDLNKLSPEDIVVDDNEVEDDNLPPASSTGLDFNPVEQEGSLEMVEEVNTAFDGNADDPGIKAIINMRRKKHKLLLKVKWDTEI